jgi:pantoate kinase
MTTRTGEHAVGFAPGHLTGLFRPELTARDPRGRGSRGAGVVLEIGATARVTVWPSERARVSVRDARDRPLPITELALRHLGVPEPLRIEVRVEHALPVGQGFGMSAAGTLAAALAVAKLAGLPSARAVAAAHLAELFGGGGLGGVAAILGGGLEVRVAPGIPPWGTVVHSPFAPALLLGVLGGPLPSPGLLEDSRFLTRVESAAGDALDRIGPHPLPEEFLSASQRFTDRLGLAPPGVRRLLQGLRLRGAWAAQAMFGRSFFAVAPSPRVRSKVLAYLAERQVAAIEVRSGRAGARARRLRQAF